MKDSLIAVGFFAAGIVIAPYGFATIFGAPGLGEYALYLLMFLVGIAVGGDRKAWAAFRRFDLKIMLVPIGVVVGSLAGGIVAGPLANMSVKDGVLVSAGFGYYSLSSILIAKFYSETVGVVALLSNLMREIFTLLAAPLLARHFGKTAPIASGGATAMDTTLPIITRSAGNGYAATAIFSGVTLTVLVPFLITFLSRYL